MVNVTVEDMEMPWVDYISYFQFLEGLHRVRHDLFALVCGSEISELCLDERAIEELEDRFRIFGETVTKDGRLRPEFRAVLLHHALDKDGLTNFEWRHAMPDEHEPTEAYLVAHFESSLTRRWSKGLS